MQTVIDAYGNILDITSDQLPKAIWEGGLAFGQLARLSTLLPFQHPAIQVACYLKRHGMLDFGVMLDFDQYQPCDIWHTDYQQCLQDMNLLLKVFRREDIWSDFLHQVEDYKYNPQLRCSKSLGVVYDKYHHNSGKMIRVTYTNNPNKIRNGTKKQSATLISPRLITPYFGSNAVSYVGLFFDQSKCQVAARLECDRGTFDRRWVGKNVKHYSCSIGSYKDADSEVNCNRVAKVIEPKN